ncbi:hypothetical protein BC939DRAFT_493942 [Gamsiella multidivaricata]|uniref:uncharacterized protein n=1 Tax=Gamsiella multidivaricata TaxID=101098 RepID=UPI00221EE5B7|nr:uncharacterized protein BC939DRAFT_493942 [Gamsiella multidivaricata]KAI7821719.1 hypothetical protein BC939DRAFT_493942 [Gamsiella multidivaricata]
MNQTITNNDSDATASNSFPSVQFSRDDDSRGRNHVIHPIAESGPTMDRTIPLTKTNTTDSTKSRRRSSLAAFAELFRTQSYSDFRSRSQSKGRNSLDENECEVEEYKHSRRRSSETGGGKYEDVVRAQALFMDKLREEQARNHITRNVDGLPIPPSMQRDRRRSSLVHILGMDKPLLAR